MLAISVPPHPTPPTRPLHHFGFGLLGAIALWLTGCTPVGSAPTRSVATPASTATGPQPSITLDPTLQAKIRQIRRGDLTVRVVDGQGKPISGATVKVQQTAHQFAFGTALSSYIFRPEVNPAEREKYLAIAQSLFNTGVHENGLKWLTNEPQRGQVSYADTDSVLTWSDQHYPIKLRGHTLFWEVTQWNQDWLKTLSPAELRNAAQQRATDVCQRYKGRFLEYDVLNEMLHDRFFRSRLGDGIVKDMFLWCKAADPDAKLYLNDYGIVSRWKINEFVQQVKDLQRQGVPIDGIGIQAHVIVEKTTPQTMQSALETVAQFNLPLKITEVSVGGETDDIQAQNLVDLYQVAFAQPAVQGIYLWGFWENAHWQPTAAIYRRDFSPKAGAIAYKDLIFNQWWTQETGTSNAQGEYKTRAFFGQHKITASVNGKSVDMTISVTTPQKQPTETTLTLK
jgi:endo-1,4-beta-xylanase